MWNSSKRQACFASLLALSMGVAGCHHPQSLSVARTEVSGSAQAVAGQGALTLTIRWPQRPERSVQVVPVAAEEAVLVVKDSADKELLTRSLSRELDGEIAQLQINLPVGHDYRLSAVMRGADGEPLAKGTSAPFSIAANQVTTVKIRLDSIIVSFAGTGVSSFEGEGVLATEATIQNPATVATDAAGNVYVPVRKSALDGNVIRKISPDGIISTVVGLPPGSSDPHLSGNGIPARNTLMSSPLGLSVSPDGDMLVGHEVYNADAKAPAVYRLLFIPARSGVRFGMDMQAGCSYELYSSSAKYESVLLGPDDTVYASQRNWVLRVNPDRSVDTVAGKPADTTGGAGLDGPATASALKTTDGLALDSHGNLFISDRNNHRVRMVCRKPGTYFGIPMQEGWIYTIAGLYAEGAWQRTAAKFPYEDGKPGLQSSLGFPRGLVFDDRGNLYISDSINALVRKLTPEGTLITVAGKGKATEWRDTTTNTWFSEPLGDGGSSLEASFYNPGGLAFGPRGELYIADTTNHRIRRIYL